LVLVWRCLCFPCTFAYQEWQAKTYGEEMPGYLEDVGVRASTTEGRKQRKLRAESRMLMDIYKRTTRSTPNGFGNARLGVR